jgi:hypothetical protein
MKYFITLLFTLLLTTHTYAARMYIDAPKTASSNRSEFVVSIFLDQEKDIVSAVSGDFSFPSSFFDIKTISTQNGVVPLWITTPHESTEKNLDGRTHISFEGIIPGGFTGVRTSYREAPYPGVVFTAILIPKGSGKGNFTLTDVELHAYDSNGTMLNTKDDSSAVTVPNLSGKESAPPTDMVHVISTTLSMNIATSSLINNGAPYVYVRDEDPSRTVDHIEIVETDKYNPLDVSISAWHTATNPYVLTHYSLSKYIHAKVVYTNNTYAYKTIAPVENSHQLAAQSRILIYIVIAIFLLYHYGKNFLHLLKENLTKHI